MTNARYKFAAGAAISGVCAGITLVMVWYTRGQFTRSSKYIPVRQALKLQIGSPSDIESGDRGKKAMGVTTVQKAKTEINNENYHVYYYQPSLVPIVDEPEIDAKFR